MTKSKTIAKLALAGVVALGLSTVAPNSMAASKAGYEQCYGVAAANKNDCGTASTACAGSIHVARDCSAWIDMPKGICEKLADSSVGAPAKDCKAAGAPADAGKKE